MNATPLITRLLAALEAQHLEAVLIGNAAAAIHGAPVTTLDFDFMFRETPTNMRKLKRVAADLGATILRPYYPAENYYRLCHDACGWRVDFRPTAHPCERACGAAAMAVPTRRIPSPRSRKKTAARGVPSRDKTLAALGAESRRQLQDLIRRRLALPIEERMNFLRRRLPGGGSCL